MERIKREVTGRGTDLKGLSQRLLGTEHVHPADYDSPRKETDDGSHAGTLIVS